MAVLTENQIKLLVVSNAMKLRPRFIVAEVAFADYRARADILIGFKNLNLIGVEIKTANDRFDRLPVQMARYNSSFHASYVAYPSEVRKKIPQTLRRGVGLIEIKDNECRVVRKARVRRHIPVQYLRDLVRDKEKEAASERELLLLIEKRFAKNYRAFKNSIGSLPLEEDMKLLELRRTEIEMRLK